MHSDVSPWWPTGSPTAAADHVAPHRAAFMLGGPAVGDLDRDGYPEIVGIRPRRSACTSGRTTGQRLATMSVDPAFSRRRRHRTGPVQPHQAAASASAPSLGDLDGDGRLEIVGGRDSTATSTRGTRDGTPGRRLPGAAGRPGQGRVGRSDQPSRDLRGGLGRRARAASCVATPTLADLDGDGHPEIIVGGQEEYVEPINIGDGADVLALLGLTGSAGNSRLYAVSPTGRLATASPPSPVQPDAQAYLPGWPARIAMVKTDLLPTIGDGVAMPVAVGDVVPAHPGPEVAVTSAAGPFYVLGADGKSVYGSTAAGDLPLLWAGGVTLAHAGDFGANRNSNDLVASLSGFGGPSVADLDGDGAKDVVAPTAGLTRLVDLNAPDRQLPSDDQLSGWSGTTRLALPGSPQAVADLAFFVQPSVVDVDGDGRPEMVAGNSTYTISAFAADGSAPPGWPKLTGGWTLGSAVVGDWDGDGHNEVVQAAARRRAAGVAHHRLGCASMGRMGMRLVPLRLVRRHRLGGPADGPDHRAADRRAVDHTHQLTGRQQPGRRRPGRDQPRGRLRRDLHHRLATHHGGLARPAGARGRRPGARRDRGASGSAGPRRERGRLTALAAASIAVAAAAALGGCRAAEPAATAPAPAPASSVVALPHFSGGTIILPRATTGLPGTTIQPGARPAVTRLDVPSSVPCPDHTSTVVTATYATENADRVAFVLDGRQLPGEAGTSGRFELTIPCDGRTHVVLVTAVSPDNQTAVDSRAVTATD